MSSPTGWDVYDIGDETGDEVHTVPDGDLVEHELDEDCVCGPETIPAKRVDGSIGWLYGHYALDGRP